MGTGFNAWSLSVNGTTGSAGTFIGDGAAQLFGDLDGTNKDFGMYGYSGNKYSNVSRTFTSLSDGHTFSIKLAINLRNGGKGIDLQVGVATQLNFHVTSDAYFIDGVNLGWANSSTSIFLIEATQTSATTIYYKVSRSSDVIFGQKTISGRLSGFHLYVGETSSSADGNNLFSNTIRIRSDQPVPVELKSFSAVSLGNKVQLKWTTATEKNNFGFEVERAVVTSGEGSLTFNKIGFVRGHVLSNSPKDYSFIDENVTFGTKYSYRLKQVDNDGTFEFSDPVEIFTGNIPDGFVLDQNYPNPFNPSTTIKFGFERDTRARLLVYDILGNQVAELFNNQTDPGRIYEIQFNAANLSSGIYYYKLTGDNKTEIKKMNLIK